MIASVKSLNVALVIGLSLATTAGCSDGEKAEAPPRTQALATFEPFPYGTQVFSAYRQDGDLTRRITLPAGSRAVGIAMDCAGTSGEVRVQLSSAGGAAGKCRPKATRPMFVANSDETPDAKDLKRDQTITVTAPEGAQWSVAVIAGPKVTAN